MTKFSYIALLLGGTLSAQQAPKQAPPTSAQQAPVTMTMMVVQLQSPDAPEGSFAAKPKTMYRAGTEYCRVEEANDVEHGIHGVMIIREPDFWMVNLDSGTAQHGVDPGPTFNCSLPIFGGQAQALPEEAKRQVMALEFGHEMEFFKKRGAIGQPGPVLQTKQTTAYQTTIGDATLALFTYGTPEKPLGVAWIQGENHAILWYSGYGEMPFDAKLFAKPEHVKIQETKR